MPVYEFYCLDCHMIFSFLSRRIDTRKRPSCPRCGRPKLERRISLFSVSRGRGEDADEGAGPDIDDARLEQAMESLAREAEGMDEDDPRQAGRLMRRLFETAGLPLSGGMEEAIRRMEAGEDPEKVEADMADVLDEESLPESPDTPGGASGPGRKVDLAALRRKLLPPSVDDTLYEY